jgi:hypothetical protein
MIPLTMIPLTVIPLTVIPLTVIPLTCTIFNLLNLSTAGIVKAFGMCQSSQYESFVV